MGKNNGNVSKLEDLFNHSKDKYYHYIRCLEHFGYNEVDYEMAARYYGEMSAYAAVCHEIFGMEHLQDIFNKMGPRHAEYAQISLDEESKIGTFVSD